MTTLFVVFHCGYLGENWPVDPSFIHEKTGPRELDFVSSGNRIVIATAFVVRETVLVRSIDQGEIGNLVV